MLLFAGTECNSALSTRGHICAIWGYRLRDSYCISERSGASQLKIFTSFLRHLGYLTGNTDVLLDTNTLNRILEVQQLPDDVKEKLFYFIDMTVRDYKAKKAYS